VVCCIPSLAAPSGLYSNSSSPTWLGVHRELYHPSNKLPFIQLNANKLDPAALGMASHEHTRIYLYTPTFYAATQTYLPVS